ncbi:MAG: glycosyltransferase [Pseudanabaenaceae cyanobacterium]
MLSFLLLLYQTPFTFVLLSRLVSAPRRIPPLEPKLDKEKRSVSVVIPTLNERERLPHCLAGLQEQPIGEVIIVDSRSTDGTREYVEMLQGQYPLPLKLVTDPPLPPDWVGRPWALNYGWQQSDPSYKWLLGLDADTIPQPGLVAAVVDTGETEDWDILTLAPQFIVVHPGEQWLQPSLLLTLVYRFGASGDRRQFSEQRVMANGQCFLAKKAVLQALGGYSLAKSSFCDDVTLVRAAAQRGYKVGFLDGAKVLQVRMYTSMAETWREWGRSLDLKDAATPLSTWGDCLYLLAVQGLPLFVLGGIGAAGAQSIVDFSLLALNLGLLLIRFLLLFAIRPSYRAVGLWYWLSPLSDPLAVLRIWLSALQKPKIWRGRLYSNLG